MFCLFHFILFYYFYFFFKIKLKGKLKEKTFTLVGEVVALIFVGAGLVTAISVITAGGGAAALITAKTVAAVTGATAAGSALIIKGIADAMGIAELTELIGKKINN